MILLKFDAVSDEVMDTLDHILEDQEIAEYDTGEWEDDAEPPEEGEEEAGDALADPPYLDPDLASFEGNAEEILDHIEERLGRLQKTALEFHEPLGGTPRTHFEVVRIGVEKGGPAVRICLVLDSPTSPDRRLYFCDTIARVDDDLYLSWDLPDPRNLPLD